MQQIVHSPHGESFSEQKNYACFIDYFLLDFLDRKYYLIKLVNTKLFL